MNRRSFIQLVIGAIVAAACPIDIGPYEDSDLAYLMDLDPADTPFTSMEPRDRPIRRLIQFYESS